MDSGNEQKNPHLPREEVQRQHQYNYSGPADTQRHYRALRPLVARRRDLSPCTTATTTTTTTPSPSPSSSPPTATSTSTDQQRSYGHVKTLSTTPPSLTIIPESDDERPGPIVAVGLSALQLSKFLGAFAKGRMRVSYVLRRGGASGSVVMVEDVRSERVERVEGGEGGREGGGGGGAEGLMKGEEEKVRRERTERTVSFCDF